MRAAAPLPFGQANTCKRVLGPVQESVADQLGQRRATALRCTSHEQPAGVDRIRGQCDRGRQQIEMFLWGVLTIAVNQSKEVETLLYRVGVSDILVTSLP
jgi:hypothetical protein